ncbi:MAG: hypothetical protein PHD05_01395 [Sphaerochaetaceae bacterium]|nr:hypothetical protein [Sphaerochaetaceae bacterium]
MNSFSKFLPSAYENTSFFGRIKQVWKEYIFSLDANRCNQVINRLMKYKPLVATSKDLVMNKLALDAFEPRIKSLEPKYLLELEESIDALEKATTKEEQEHITLIMLYQINSLYSLNGWFLKRVASTKFN